MLQVWDPPRQLRVRDNDDCAVRREGAKHVPHNVVGSVNVDTSRWLVENDDREIRKKNSCERDALSLTSRDEGPVFSHTGVESVTSLRPLVQSDAFESSPKLLIVRIRTCEQQVLSQIGIEEMRNLFAQPNPLPDVMRAQRPCFRTRELIASFVLKKSHEHRCERCLARTTLTGHDERFSGVELE